jgi:hypothetical protein
MKAPVNSGFFIEHQEYFLSTCRRLSDVNKSLAQGKEIERLNGCTAAS